MLEIVEGNGGSASDVGCIDRACCGLGCTGFDKTCVGCRTCAPRNALQASSSGPALEATWLWEAELM